MKILFLLSLVLNGVLGFLYWKEASKPPLERSIIETHEEPRVIEKKIYVKVPARSKEAPAPKANAEESSSNIVDQQYVEFDPKAYELGLEKVTNDRENYLLEKLELAPEDLQKIEKIKKDFYKEADRLILGQNEPTIEQRRQLLDLEESREKEFSRIVGEEKWEKFKKYRDDYNRKNYERQMDDQTLFIPMDI